MDGLDNEHEAHADHPVSASLVALVIVAAFATIFALMTTKTFDTPVALVTVILSVWGLGAIWVLDRD